MKNIFQDGLALGIDLGACRCCNINFSWLFNSPSNLLWVDKIYITQTMWDLITKDNKIAEFGEGKSEASSKGIKLIFEILNSVNLIEIIDVKSKISEEQSNLIFSQIEDDLELLANNYEVDDDGHIFNINNDQYCAPELWTLYASLILSREYNANFTLYEHHLNYLKLLLPLKYNITNIGSNSNIAINEVLKVSLPSIKIGHEYMFDSVKQCNVCTREIDCKDSYLNEIERNVFKVLEQREYDEIKQFCQVLDKICSTKFKSDYEIEPVSLLRELNIEKAKIQKNINKIYPKINRWNNLTTTISSILSLGAFIGRPELTAIGGAGIIASQASQAVVDYYSSKNKWANFVTTNKLIK